MITVQVFGNEWLRSDALAKEVAKEIKQKGIRFRMCTSPDDLVDAKGDIIILDVVKNIRKPVIIKDLKQLKTRKLVSLHDYDLGFFLTLMQKLGKIKSVTIIGLPKKGNVKVLRDVVGALISKSCFKKGG